MFITTWFVCQVLYVFQCVFATDIILSYKQVVPKGTTKLDIFIFRDIQQWSNQDIPVYPVLRVLPIIIMIAAGAIFVARAVASYVSMLMANLRLVRIRSTGLLLMKSNGISSSIQIILLRGSIRWIEQDSRRLRWWVLANLDDYGGEVFASTMSKKIVHLSANSRVTDMDTLFYLIIISM